MRIAAASVLLLMALGSCNKPGEPTKEPAGAPRLPVVVEPSVPPPAPGAELPPAPAATPTVPATPAPAAPPKVAQSAFSGDFDLVGAEPFWNLKIRPDGLTLARLGHGDLTAPNPGFNEFGATAMWNATAGRSRMTVTITKAACTDGMSDRAYPYAAKVTIWGATLSGCAAHPSA